VHADRSRGVLATTPLPGVPLWSCIVDGADRALGPGEVLATLDAIKDVPLEFAARRPATETVRLNLRTLAAVLPGQADALARFEERLGEPAPQLEITVHGDFHEVQLLVSGGAVSGVLDLDDAGRGHRVDDLAMLLGRLHAYARDEPQHAAELDAYVDAALAEWEDEVDPVELRRSVCAVCMNHALQPFRSQEPEWPSRCERGIGIALELQARLMGQ